VWPAPELGGELRLRVASLDEPLFFYAVGLSTGFLPGFTAFGFQIPLNVDGVFLAVAADPQFFNVLDSEGSAEIVVPLSPSPVLSGLTIYGNAVTLELISFEFVGSMQTNLIGFTL
jgi:hypothetical protein